jgi:hypothetical protein
MAIIANSAGQTVILLKVEKTDYIIIRIILYFYRIHLKKGVEEIRWTRKV